MSAVAKLTKRKFVVVCMDLVVLTTVITSEFPVTPKMTMMMFKAVMK